MVCRFCKRKIADNTRICPYCLSDHVTQIQSQRETQSSTANDRLSDPFLASPKELIHDTSAVLSQTNCEQTENSINDRPPSFQAEKTWEYRPSIDTMGETQRNASFSCPPKEMVNAQTQQRKAADTARDESDKPLSTGTWLGYSLLFAVPLFGWLSAVIFSCAAHNQNLRCFARSRLLLLVLLVLCCAGAWFLFRYYAPNFMEQTLFPLFLRFRDWVFSYIPIQS